jgi:phosphohistidine phosphatase
MELCFFRHGIAAERDDSAFPTDRDRPLTEEGIRKTQEAAEGLKRLGMTFDRILTSPLLRASQTAEILAEVLGLKQAVEALPQLSGDSSVEELLGALARRRPGRSLLLVGHQPLLGQTVARLLSPTASFEVDLKKSGAAAIEVETLQSRVPGTLLWLLTSRQLRMIGKG